MHPGMILDQDEKVEEKIIKIKDDATLGEMADPLEKKEEQERAGKFHEWSIGSRTKFKREQCNILHQER